MSTLRFAEVELLDGLIHIGLVVFGNDHGAFGEEQNARLTGKHVEVVLGWNRQRENPLADAVDVDLDDNGFFFLLVLIVFALVLVGR